MNLLLLSWGEQGWLDEMCFGAVMTLSVSVCAYLLGILIGAVITVCKLSSRTSLRVVGNIYTTVIRGIPELLIIYLVFFGGSAFVRWLAQGLFGYQGYIDLPIFFTGMVCIGLSAGAYSAEVMRGAVLSVPRGLLEAASACGMHKHKRTQRILIPLALRYALPGLNNVWQLTLKETSLISVIGLTEIMRHAAIASGSTREPFTFYLLAFLLYLLLTSLSNQGWSRLENLSNKGVRRVGT